MSISEGLYAAIILRFFASDGHVAVTAGVTEVVCTSRALREDCVILSLDEIDVGSNVRSMMRKLFSKTGIYSIMTTLHASRLLSTNE